MYSRKYHELYKRWLIKPEHLDESKIFTINDMREIHKSNNKIINYERTTC